MLCIMQVECGILILENNKTYGLVLASAKSKHYYKCIPNNSELPHFLIPYEHKHIGFSKVFKNHYITFLPIEPSSTQKHPIGKLVQNIGPVDILEHFYEYQLYCKNIFYSLQQFTKNTLNKREEIKEYEKVMQRVYQISKEAYTANQPLFIDAEESWIQPAIDSLANENIALFNQEKAIIYSFLKLVEH